MVILSTVVIDSHMLGGEVEIKLKWRTNPRSKRSCEVAVRNSYSKKGEILYCLRILGGKYVIRTVNGVIYCTELVLSFV